MNKRFACCSLLLFSTAFASPVLAAGLTQMEQLGKVMYQDKDFSRNKTQSCQTCHHHISGFADPTNMRDPYNTFVSLGDDGVSKGGRNAPSSAYAGFSPALAKNAEGAYVGGMFWDGRATGLSVTLGDPLAEQAQGPPLNPVEMNMPDKEAVVEAVRSATYANLFRKVFGSASLNDADTAYDNIARAIAAYERSQEVQAFTSRFDAGQLNTQEENGQELFKVNCAKCHSMENVDGKGPLFTNYTYANIGVPTNPKVSTEQDFGLGGFLDSTEAPEEFASDAADEMGKFKVPTLRNIAFTAPYAHNGFFPTLKDIVMFKNTRDVDSWPEPNVKDNLNTTDLGDLKLTDQDVDDIVAFLLTLTDK
jgi:cytochrome c peroxidase